MSYVVPIETLRGRLRTLLPQEYQERYDDMEPVSMGSAKLKYGPDGSVAWGAIWEHFCDLALAGGPPHRGRILNPALHTEVEADVRSYAAVVEEIAKGLRLTTNLVAHASSYAGWVRVDIGDAATAQWMARAIAVENLSVQLVGSDLDLPASPTYRPEKEIKNVIATVAKVHHYWQGHMWPAQHRTIGQMLCDMEDESPLIQAGRSGHETLASQGTLQSAILRAAEETGDIGIINIAPSASAEWLGLVSPNVRVAQWMLRMLVASNILARREESTVFLPVNQAADPGGRGTSSAFMHIARLASKQEGLVTSANGSVAEPDTAKCR